MRGAVAILRASAVGALVAGVIADQNVLQPFAGSDKILITNDDGWAVAQIRAEYAALKDAGYNVILSAPAENKSGSGGLLSKPGPRTTPCEFNSCPADSGATGFNASDPRLNWVNGYPADAADFGINTLAPQFFAGVPDLVVSGPNVGPNTGLSVFVSGTVGAAGHAVHLNVPAVAFSGADGSTAQEAWTDLSTAPKSATVVGAETYAAMTTKFLHALFAQPPTSPALLPADTLLNVNFPALSGTCNADSVQWVLTRAFPKLLWDSDVEICNNGGTLPNDGTVVGAGCFASVSALSPTLKLDSDSDVQADVLHRLSALGFVCFSG
ncbi:SurE-like protein [Phanerochaete sordida]|uniref:SurE-like protein n=1 Tax=Phanerochaete sordida TaxID=48140 RepID=A0A9P3GSL9_9APHY|nr:SurE-like protein [Phanerochaete sordida]